MCRLSLEVCTYLRLSKEKFATNTRSPVLRSFQKHSNLHVHENWRKKRARWKNKKNPNYKAAKTTVERWQKSSWCDRSHSTIEQHIWRGLDEESLERGLFEGNVSADLNKAVLIWIPELITLPIRLDIRPESKSSSHTTSITLPRHFVLNVWH